MGASDAGKTTLCLLASGLAPSLTGGTQEGHVCVAGRDTGEYPPPALATDVGLVFQNPTAQLFNPTVEAEVAWGLENLALPLPEMRARLGQALSRFGIESLRHRSPLTLSGGEKKRLALASVLAMQPSVLVLDEPMGGLDPAGREQVLAALSGLLHDKPVTILMTESDPEAVAAFASRLAILSGGRLIIDDTPRSALSQGERLAAAGVAVPQMAQLAAALNQRTSSAFDFLTVDEAQRALVLWLEREPAPGRSPSQSEGESPLSQPAGARHAAVELQGLWHWYEEERRPVLRDIDLLIGAGELVALVGANGSGKTTLVKHMNGLLRPRRGCVRILGKDSAGRTIGEMARSVGFLFQNPEQQIFSATVQDEIAFGPRNLKLSPTEAARRVGDAIERFDLAGVAHQPPAILSYGLRRRLTLASLAAMDPPILVLDEPSVGLDAAGRDDLVHWLREKQEAGRTIVLVTHDMALVAECAGRMVVLRDGEIVADGTPAQLFWQPELLQSASLAPPPVVALAQALRPYGLHRRCLGVDAVCQELAVLTGRA